MKIVQVESLGVSIEELELAKQEIEALGHEFVYYTNQPQDENELIERMQDADIVNISNIKVSSSVIEKCRKLQYLNIAFTGVDHVDLEACRRQNIKVSNAAGYSTEAVSELAIGLAINVLRNVKQMDNNTHDLLSRNNFLGVELNGKTVGIVGTGSIGIATARLFNAFGCKVIAHSRTEKNIDFIKYVSLSDLFEQADIISLHIPANPTTNKLINRELMQKMKSTAIIINTARGTIIDNQALADLLNSGQIAGAGIDVYETEPPLKVEHPLLSAKNAIIVPHIGYATKEAMQKRFVIIKNNILSYLSGKQENIIIN